MAQSCPCALARRARGPPPAALTDGKSCGRVHRPPTSPPPRRLSHRSPASRPRCYRASSHGRSPRAGRSPPWPPLVGAAAPRTQGGDPPPDRAQWPDRLRDGFRVRFGSIRCDRSGAGRHPRHQALGGKHGGRRRRLDSPGCARHRDGVKTLYCYKEQMCLYRKPRLFMVPPCDGAVFQWLTVVWACRSDLRGETGEGGRLEGVCGLGSVSAPSATVVAAASGGSAAGSRSCTEAGKAERSSMASSSPMSTSPPASGVLGSVRLPR